MLKLDELPRSWSPEAHFLRAAPLELEVGSGKGLFLATASVATPDHDFLGVEIGPAYARAAAARLARSGVRNAAVVCGDALRFLAEHVPDERLAALHVYFPDPWWKRRHRKRRVVNARLLAEAERTLAPGGRLHFWTDVEEYFRSSLKLLTASRVLVGPRSVEERPAEHEFDYRTHFERRTRMHGQPVYRVEFEKPA